MANSGKSRSLMWPAYVALIVLALASLLPARTVLAQSTPTPDQVDAVAKDLWCPLCSGVRLDNCELKACDQMKDVIAQKLAEGQSKDEIKAYFVSQYGGVVLGEPSKQGFNLLAWLLPILIGLIAAASLIYMVVKWQRRGAPAHASAGADRSPAAQDDYLKRVDEELNKYE